MRIIWLILAAALTGPSLWAASADAPLPNVLLISIDTLRADHLSCYGYARRTSPYIDGLAREGTRFSRAYTVIPLTGPAQLYSVIPHAEYAYFQYVNFHGGVHGRKINFKYYDDGYNPANTVPLTHKLVEQDHVFAVYGSLGTAPTLATRDYLNKASVPGARRDRRLVLGFAVQAVPVDDRLPAGLPG